MVSRVACSREEAQSSPPILLHTTLTWNAAGNFDLNVVDFAGELLDVICAFIVDLTELRALLVELDVVEGVFFGEVKRVVIFFGFVLNGVRSGRHVMPARLIVLCSLTHLNNNNQIEFPAIHRSFS